MGLEAAVSAHYGRTGLQDRIDAALRQSGLDPSNLSPQDLRPLEHLHTGGRDATVRLIDALDLHGGDLAIDIGCGIGGTAREIATRTGARVIGIDLTSEYTEIARTLGFRTGFGTQTRFVTASALHVPISSGTADAASILHVGMNIDDKHAMMAEAFRLLKPGGRLALFDVMRGPNPEPLDFPVPWAKTRDTSFLAPAAHYRDAARACGFLPRFEETMPAPAPPDGPPRLPILGPHLWLGDTADEKVTHHQQHLADGRITATLMLFTKPEGRA